ncbi:MAG: hypothetical protein KDB00_25455 [Planctomycetales bacterium]|nr:hypothetical protein [Planctomycetales bacterium]
MPASPLETRASLILRLRNPGDVAAWDEFVGLYGPVIYRASRRRGLQAADVDGLSIPEAAKKLRTRPGNIHFARSRVMARIKELVERTTSNRE